MSLNWKELLISLTITPSNRNYNCKQDFRLFMNTTRDSWLGFAEYFLSLGIFFNCLLFRQKSYPNPNPFSPSYCSLFIFRFSNGHVFPSWPAWNKANNGLPCLCPVLFKFMHYILLHITDPALLSLSPQFFTAWFSPACQSPDLYYLPVKLHWPAEFLANLCIPPFFVPGVSFWIFPLPPFSL